MFDISLGEMALILMVAVLAIGPKELPAVIKKVSQWIRQLRMLSRQITDQFSDVAGVSDITSLREELREQAKFIRDAEGNLYRTYDISDMMPSPTSSPLPLGEVGEAKAKPGEGHHGE